MAELEEKTKPKPKFVSDYVAPSPFAALDRAEMPPSEQRAMVDAPVNVGDLVRDAIHRRSPSAGPTSQLTQSEASAGARPPLPVNTSGTREPAPLGLPGGDRAHDLIAEMTLAGMSDAERVAYLQDQIAKLRARGARTKEEREAPAKMQAK